jgi:hypothetical protein
MDQNMIISKKTIEKIKEIIENKYASFTISMLGSSVFSDKELKNLGLSRKNLNNESLLALAYNHNFINQQKTTASPTSISDMKAQQSAPGVVPVGEAHDYTIEHLNENAAQLLSKLKENVASQIEGMIRESNNQFKFNSLQNLDRPDEVDDIIKQGMVSQIKQKLRDTSGDATRDWNRVAVTEVSNSVGLGATDAIVARNRDSKLDEVYVFRITVGDAKVCKFCNAFYVDTDGSPRVYRLSTLLSNGSNYGKKSSEWKPVSVATHPNERCAAPLELPPGYKVLKGGTLTYIGMEAWEKYIREKVSG